MKIFYSPKCKEYKQEGHPESPHRVKLIVKALEDEYKIDEAEACSDKQLESVHSPDLIGKVKEADFFDADTPNFRHAYDFALLAAGSAIQSADVALKGKNSFSLMRPPGHHSGKTFLGGFCYFNNIAIAVEHALQSTDKIAILDIDGHHGNGTQDIFLGRDDVLFVSLHQKNAFPGSGHVSEKNCFNFPLNAGTATQEYLKILQNALEKVEDFNPDVIAVSAGFDAYIKDPLLQLELDLIAYREVGHMIAQLEKPVFAVLEGGYSVDLGICVKNFLSMIE